MNGTVNACRPWGTRRYRTSGVRRASLEKRILVIKDQSKIQALTSELGAAGQTVVRPTKDDRQDWTVPAGKMELTVAGLLPQSVCSERTVSAMQLSMKISTEVG